MKFILFISLLFISCSKNLETSSIDENKNLSIEAELLSNEYFEIYLLDQFNENRGYCIDIKGSKINADPNRGLQAHTCYSYQGEISVDQGFDNDKIDQDEFYMPFFNVCMEAEIAESSSNLQLRSCNQNEKQKFKFNSNNEIILSSNNDLCLTVSDDSREGGGGNPIHLIRDLSIENCNSDISSRQKWGLRKTQ